MPQSEFEFSRAPRLYKCLSTVVPLFFRSRIEKFTWETALEVICEIGKVVQLAHAYEKVLESSVPRVDESSWGGMTDSASTLARTLLEEMLQKTSPDRKPRPGAQSSQQIPQDTPCNRDLPKMGPKGSRLFGNFLEVVSQKITDDYLDYNRALPGPFQVNGMLIHQHMRRMFRALELEEPDRHHRCFDASIRSERLVNVRRALDEFKEPDFDPRNLSLETLKTIDSQWKVVWISDLSAHLAIGEKEIYVYWPSTTLFQRPR